MLKRKTPLAKKNKFNAKTTQYKGYSYDSAFEAKVAAYLDLMQSRGDFKKWERQFTTHSNAYNKFGDFAFSKSHKVDFRIHENDGTYTLLEAKGLETNDYKNRKQCVEKLWLPENTDHKYDVIYLSNAARTPKRWREILNAIK